MKKKAFTLSELIVSLSVVGIASALMMPTITNLVPDKNKIKILNIHARIVNALESLIDDDTVYYCNSINDENDIREGLSCDQIPTRFEFRNDPAFSGDSKFENLMAYQLNLVDAPNGDANFRRMSNDGVYWSFERGCDNGVNFTPLPNGACANNSLAYRITLDVNGINQPASRAWVRNPNSLFNPNGETKPDRFRFRVDNLGGVTPDDALTAAYIKNSIKSTKKKEDRADAVLLYNNNMRYSSN